MSYTQPKPPRRLRPWTSTGALKQASSGPLLSLWA